MTRNTTSYSWLRLESPNVFLAALITAYINCCMSHSSAQCVVWQQETNVWAWAYTQNVLRALLEYAAEQP
jgi:hypothetical protein